MAHPSRNRFRARRIARVREPAPPEENLVVQVQMPIVGLINNDAITTWFNSVVGGPNATQSTAINKPQYKIDAGVHSVKFNAGGDGHDFFTIALDTSAYTAASIFVVIKAESDPSVGGDAGLWTLSDADFNAHYPFTDGVVYDNAWSTVRKTVGNLTPDLSTQYRLYDVISASGSWKARLDTVEVFSTGTNTVDGATSLEIGRGNIAAGNFGFAGNMKELLIYSAALSTIQRDTMDEYIDYKFNIP